MGLHAGSIVVYHTDPEKIKYKVLRITSYGVAMIPMIWPHGYDTGHRYHADYEEISLICDPIKLWTKINGS